MKRNWDLALAKVFAEERRCRRCKKRTGVKVEAAHILGREHDPDDPVRPLRALEIEDALPPQERAGVVIVAPDRIVPLCGPATDLNTCHGAYDAHRLDLLPYLTREEQVQAVADVGLENARIRITGERM